MGNLKSHFPNSSTVSIEVDEPSTEGDGMITPVSGEDTYGRQAPKSKAFMGLLDPRSPTIGVSRTPVEIVAERERTRVERAKRLTALGLANTNEQITTPTATIGFIDPRSPTFEYKRTPIAFEGGDECGGDGDQGRRNQGGTPNSSETNENDNMLQVPVSNPVIRDLRKRLFVSQLNDSMNATGITEDDKEN